MKFLAMVLALVISAEAVKVKSNDAENAGKYYYAWKFDPVTTTTYVRKCFSWYGSGSQVDDSNCGG